ncbi:RimK family alpha-L-glutamate ligase [Irregularibacter muris]|uniref:RimK family alpha-L-glutamate ligase n=1 Tax=Irregularibacter muris TaxID=1796619 RepID=A0AAE3HFB2_9FIRM|nr:RimK family alpha-L-glutamate ligase [Irregularibacter muris]MCR1899517.1 RimK family alpha-L-glutamate ligase [Irregularibacter muris]
MRGWILYQEYDAGLKKERHEIERFIQEAEKQNIELRIVAPEQFDLIVTRDDRKSVIVDGEVVPLPDFLLPRLGASTTYFALAVIRHLERLGVYTINSSESIEAVKDKLYSQQILASMNMPVPKTMLAKYPINIDMVEKQFGFPVIVKTLSGAQGTGVFLSESKSKFKDLMDLINATNHKANIIVQEFVADSAGRDLRVFTVGGRALACMERISQDGNFKANIAQGGTMRQVELTSEIEWIATETSRILNLEVAGIDLLFDGEHFKICEANSSPGFKAMEACYDINIPEEIFSFIRVRLGLFD